MKIKVDIIHQGKGNDFPSLITQTFESWQKAFKECQKLINKKVLPKGGRVLKVTINDEEVTFDKKVIEVGS